MSSKNSENDKFREVRINMMVCVGDIHQLYASIYDAISSMSQEEIDRFSKTCDDECARGIGFLRWRDIHDIAYRMGLIMNIMCIDDPLFAAKEFLKTRKGEKYAQEGLAPFKERCREAKPRY